MTRRKTDNPCLLFYVNQDDRISCKSRTFSLNEPRHKKIADQRLCFPNKASRISLLPKSEISSCWCTVRFVLDLVDRSSPNEPQYGPFSHCLVQMHVAVTFYVVA